jgi:hypothetical protein
MTEVDRLKAENDSLRVRAAELEAEGRILRELLWLRHGCASSALYGDDGELQDAGCGIDFRRMSAADIQDRFTTIGIEQFARAALSPTTDPEIKDHAFRREDGTDTCGYCGFLHVSPTTEGVTK